MKCPHCKEQIDDDSRYCDQCGQALMFCPDCGRPKHGTECPACGANLVDASTFFGEVRPVPPITATQHVGNNTEDTTTARPTSLSGDNMKLVLKEGVFGRTTGIYPELSASIYISGRHGELRLHESQWQIRDLGSRNGTFVNGCRLTENQWVSVKLGDTIKIATTKFKVE